MENHEEDFGNRVQIRNNVPPMNFMVKHENFMSGAKEADKIDEKMYEHMNSTYAKDRAKAQTRDKDGNLMYEPEKPFGWTNTPPLNLMTAHNFQSMLMNDFQKTQAKNSNIMMASKMDGSKFNIKNNQLNDVR